MATPPPAEVGRNPRQKADWFWPTVEWLQREYRMTFEQAVWETPLRRVHMLGKAFAHNHGDRQDWGEVDIMIRTAELYEASRNG